ncbi:enoyl-CoA hydratase/isomerase family protein [Acidobacteriota bacterium]
MEKSKIAEWELHGEFGALVINNPPQNYLDDLEFAHIDDVRRWTGDDSPVKGAIITGKGRHFCAGANRDNIFKLRNEKEVQETARRCNSLFNVLYKSSIPTAAAIEGACWGGGLELALSCHIRVCSEKALFSLPEAGVGIMPLFAVTLLPKLIGIHKTLDLALTTRLIDAQEALKWGIVDYVVPSKQSFDFSLELLKKVTRNREASVIRAAMKSLRNGRDLPLDEAAEKETVLAASLVLEQLKIRGTAGE